MIALCMSKSDFGIFLSLLLIIALVAIIVLIGSYYHAISDALGVRQLQYSKSTLWRDITNHRLFIKKKRKERLSLENGNKDQSRLASHPDTLKIAWLMSFPNSSTLFTSRLIHDATATNSASNYADETPAGFRGLYEPAFGDQQDGPYWILPGQGEEFTKPTRYVLTKVRQARNFHKPISLNF
jgi:hypothetical protein